jgi:hypothetical protein
MIKQWVIICQIPTNCFETGNRIESGDEMLYIPGSKYNRSKCYSKNSNAYKFACENSAITGFKC